MKVLMFGWEYPPHVYGGLATANFGIAEGLHAQPDMDITLCLPKPWGDEDRTFAKIIGMNCVPIAYRDVNYDYVKDRISHIMEPELYYKFRDHIYADFNYMNVNDLGCMEFAGGYPSKLHEEINNYSIIAGVVARSMDFDIIHAHDWLTFPAGIHAKQVSGKPLCIHVHATDFDRSRGMVFFFLSTSIIRILASASLFIMLFIHFVRSFRTFLVLTIQAKKRSLPSLVV